MRDAVRTDPSDRVQGRSVARAEAARTSAFLLRHRWLVAIFLVLSAWLVAHTVWANWITAEPLNQPISLSPPSRVETDIQIRLPEFYGLALAFSVDGMPRAEADRLIVSTGWMSTVARAALGSSSRSDGP
jgi:hypothetical protein